MQKRIRMNMSVKLHAGSNKMNAFDVLDGLLLLESENKGVNVFFEHNDVHIVMLYGFGRIGQRVYKELLNAGVEVECVIDRDAPYLESDGIKFYTPEYLKSGDQKSDLIIVTPMEHYFDIKEELEGYTDIDIISIGEVVEYCIDGEEDLGVKVKRRSISKTQVETEPAIDIDERSKKILVFGGGSGIGKAIATKMAESGSEVVIAGRGEDKLRATVAEIDSDRCQYMVADISVVSKHNEYFDEAHRRMAGLDAFVNAAAISLETKGRGFEPWDITEEEWDEVSNTDFKAAYFLIRNEVDYFLKCNKSGNILNISSNSAYMDIIGLYGASKLSLMKWTRAFGKKYGHHGIIINGIAPGITFTPMVEVYAKSEDQSFPRHAIERFIRADEIAELSKYLLSPKGVILCGSTVIADGGDSKAFV